MGSLAQISSLAKNKKPFLFVISYDKSEIFVEELDNIGDIYYKLDDKSNIEIIKSIKTHHLYKNPISFKEYKKSIDRVKNEIKNGNSYLLNLTFKTQIETNLSLKDIFLASNAKFKLYFQDKFICFSPERFIEIKGNKISTYPMKGTIDADIPNAKEKILNSTKEMAEHTMMVDLMRNDLGIIGNSIEVEKFRYIDKVLAGEKKLLQVSSKISAKLDNNWQRNLGDILDKILPAGSITGTPKKKTIELIDDIEDYQRGFYSGIFGIFDGENLDSSVMIRFIEKDEKRLFYKSGGGITIDSNDKDEYQEMIDKIYLPFL